MNFCNILKMLGVDLQWFIIFDSESEGVFCYKKKVWCFCVNGINNKINFILLFNNLF